ncbi:hypothetical protein DFI02_104281 [Rhizobium sp. PP-F2F-G20b]|nr:hypothetical protein DFI02_104281 [Rhizobium sp. PP-F2F-G20b]
MGHSSQLRWMNIPPSDRGVCNVTRPFGQVHDGDAAADSRSGQPRRWGYLPKQPPAVQQRASVFVRRAVRTGTLARSYFYAFAIAGAWYVPPLTRIPHIGRAILLAKATPTTLWGRFTVIDISQSSIFEPLRACFMIDVHQRSGAVRNGLLPGFEILLSRSFLRCSSQICVRAKSRRRYGVNIARRLAVERPRHQLSL